MPATAMTREACDWMRRVFRLFLDNACITHAAGLSFFALLALVPILCCILVAAKACHVDRFAREQINQRIDFLIENIEDGQNDSFLSHLPGFSTEEQRKRRAAAEEFGRQARHVTNELFGRIETFDVQAFGWIGFAFLLWTVISSLGSVESSFNRIFAVERDRPVWKRAYLYLLIMIALPILMAMALSLPILNLVRQAIVATLGASWLTNWASDGLLALLDSAAFRAATALLFSSVGFGLFFWAIPNCRINLRHAWYGGLVTAALLGGWLKVCSVAQVGIARASALYGSFAFLPIVLAWLHVSWQLVLLGACMIRALDERSRLTPRRLRT